MTDLTRLVNDFMKKYPEVRTAKDMNETGYCGMFAEFVRQQMPYVRISNSFRDDPMISGHFWIELEGKYYDSEAPKGVSHPDRLPYFRRRFK